MVVAIAAAAVGRLVSLPGAFAGGIGLGMLGLANTFLPRWSDDHLGARPGPGERPGDAVHRAVRSAGPVAALRTAREQSDPLSGVDPPSLAAPSTAAGP